MNAGTLPADSQSPPKSAAESSIDNETQRLVAAGKCKQAVELAKEQHKRLNTPESQRTLIQAYVARIEQFQNKGMSEEAQTLLNLVQDRFPTARQQLGTLAVRTSAATGNMNDLLRPLASGETTAESRAYIEATIARFVVDLPAIAACDVLPKDHPLRIGAAAAWRAFLAVTSGPATETDIALPEISRRSPLAAWKLLVRAIASFYQRDDAACRRSLDAIPLDSAVAPVVAVVRGLVDGVKPTAGIAAALFSRVLVDDQPLLSAIGDVQSSYNSYDARPISPVIRHAIRLCSQTRPEYVEQLKRLIFIDCLSHGVSAGAITPAIGVMAIDAAFWRQCAQTAEIQDLVGDSAMYWDCFRRHAIQEGQFAERSLEAGAVLLHIAELLSSLTPRELENEPLNMDASISPLYEGQSAAISALKPKSETEWIDTVLNPGSAFRLSAEIAPHEKTFAMWLHWSRRIKLPGKGCEDIASRWHNARPSDVKPLIILCSIAEDRGALAVAMRRLAEAEKIDPLHAVVRKARLRLTLATLWRHFSDRKAHLVEKDILDLQSLPAMVEGERAGVLESIRGALHNMRGDHVAEQASRDAVAKQMGPALGDVIFDAIRNKAELKPAQKGAVERSVAVQTPALEIALARARAMRLDKELQLCVKLPTKWSRTVRSVLQQRPCPLSIADLISLGTASVTTPDPELNYLATAAGLHRSDSTVTTAQFLLLRAESLKRGWQYSRRTQCLRAALSLARQAHAETLMDEIFSAIDIDRAAPRFGGRSGHTQGLSEALVEEVLKIEREADQFPKTWADNDRFVAPGAVDDTAQVGWGVDDSSYSEESFEDVIDIGAATGLVPGSSPVPTFSPLPALTPAELEEIDRIERTDGFSIEDLFANSSGTIDAMAKSMGMNLSSADLKAFMENLLQKVRSSSSVQPDKGPGPRGKNRGKGRR